ncbi:MAG: YabP/YqfC family sporulation protein [Oscillospiraceae bacterium]|nr:YabP/YqfC family sporulation protein [Oscillospiraceae bacterium]
MQKKNHKKMLERVSEAFELPGEVLAGIPKFSLTGNRRMHIEGHRGVLGYDDAVITINCGAVVLRVYGRRLEIISMNAEELLIAGYIEKLEFERFSG